MVCEIITVILSRGKGTPLVCSVLFRAIINGDPIVSSFKKSEKIPT